MDGRDHGFGGARVAGTARPWTRRLLVALWGVGVALANVSAACGDLLPGRRDPAPRSWPTGAGLRHDGRPTVLVFVHGECPCNRASLRRIARLVAGTAGRARLVFVFAPIEEPTRSRTWRALDAWPGAERQVDAERRLAAEFGAWTSGLVLLYDAAGVLRFEGGITPSRGHEGENAGAAALRSALEACLARPGSAAPASAWQVFGCPLTAPRCDDPALAPRRSTEVTR